MTDKEKIAALVAALRTISVALGIRRDFCPLGVALELEPIIKGALKAADTDLYT